MDTSLNIQLRHLLRSCCLVVSAFLLFQETAVANPDYCSLLFKPPFSEWNDADLVAQTQKNLAYLRKVPYEYTSLLIANRTVIRGLPNKASEALFSPRILTSEEVKTTVFRHYTTPEGLEKIATKKRLVTGPVSYVGSPYVYPDVTGVFLTTSSFKQEKIGLDSEIHSRWIDFHLPEGTAVLWLEPGIYVIPGSTRVPDWLIQSLKAGTQPASQVEKVSSIGYSAMEVPILPHAIKSADAIKAPTAP